VREGGRTRRRGRRGGTAGPCRSSTAAARLEAREDGSAETAGVGPLGELAAELHALEALDHEADPGVEAAGEVDPSGLVAAGELTGERPERAAGAIALRVLLDQPVEPTPEVGEAVDLVELRALAVDGLTDAPGDHRSHQVLLVGEVVVQLALAGAGSLEDLVEPDAPGPSLGHQRGRGVDDALAAAASTLGERFIDHHLMVADWTI